MKKTVILLIVIGLVAVGLIGFLLGRGGQNSSPVAELEVAPQETAETVTENEAPGEVRVLDFDALYASHDPDEIVLESPDGQLTWREYFYLLYSQARQISDYFDTMRMYYGVSEDWGDVAEGEDTTYAQLVVDSAAAIGRQFLAIEGYAKDHGVTLTQENEDELRQMLEEDILSACGEGATEEDFDAHLDEIYMTRALYDRIQRTNLLYQENFNQVYGQDGTLFDEAAAVAYLEENGYMAAHHILLLNSDETTGEPLSEERLAENRALMEQWAQELQAIEDPQERLTRFAELKAEFCQDGGKITYPDGYTFTPGTMVPAFEEAALALEPYQVSEPVESDYGIHLIMRLPLTAQNLVFGNTPRTALALAANADYGRTLQEKLDGLQVELKGGVDSIDLTQYLRELPTE